MAMVTVTPISWPADMAGQANGQLDPSLVVQVHPRGRLHHLAADAWRALVAECLVIGLPLTFTYGGMDRTYQDQLDLWYQRMTTAPQAGRPRKWWRNQWWYLKPGMADVAIPGTSNHGWLIAVDVAFDTDPTDGLGPDDAAAITGHPQWAAFTTLAPKYGWSWEYQPTLSQPGGREPWHIRYVAGDAIPPAVTQWKNGAVDSLPPFVPEAGVWGLWPIVAKPVTKLGDTGDRVRYLQGVLKLKAGQTEVGAVDGSFGPKTEQAVKNVQAWNQMTVDGWVGTKTWAKIDQLAVQ